MALLELHDVNTYYGNVRALKDVSLKVEEGQIVTLIGANGAGKSTTLRTVSGLVRPQSGEIVFDGAPIHRMPAHRIVFQGLTQAPELPATNLAQSCYSGMFVNCRGLTQAPALPATTLAEYCYADMFIGCMGLTAPPALPAMPGNSISTVVPAPGWSTMRASPPACAQNP